MPIASSKASKLAQHEIMASMVQHVTPVIKPEFDVPEVPRFA